MIDHLPSSIETAFPAALMDRLRDGAHEARGTMAPETMRAMRRGFIAFQSWCIGRETPPLPALPEIVADYVDALAAIPNRKVAGIRQAVWAIGAMHRLGQCPDPTKAGPVRLALKRVSRLLGTRQTQAAPIGQSEVRQIVETAGARAIDLRDIALLLVMRDLLARRSEVVALDVEDILFDPDGSAIALIQRSKTDQDAQGVELYLSPHAVTYLRKWCAVGAIADGPIFRSVTKGGTIGDRLQGAEVARILKRLAERTKLTPEAAARVSGHSCRIGMAQDLVAAGADMAGVMQAGRWKSATMPARYSARLEAKRGAVARLYSYQSSPD